MTDAATAYAGTAAEPFGVGRIVSTTIKLISRRLPLFVILAAVCVVVPTIASSAILAKLGFGSANAAQQILAQLGQSNGKQQFAGLSSLFSLISIVAGCAAIFFHAAVASEVIRDVEGSDAARPWSMAWRQILPLIGIAIIVGIAMVGGFILLVVPGVLVALALCVAFPVRIAERRGVFASIQRSRDLTRGYRWRIFLACLAYFGAVVVLQMVLAVVRLVLPISAITWTITVTPLLSGVTSLFGAVGIAVIYCELRAAKEGARPTDVAAAFA
jgi:uncharacterized membrane protein